MPLINEGKDVISQKQSSLEEDVGVYADLARKQQAQSDLVQKGIEEEEALQRKYQSSIKFYEDEVKGTKNYSEK